MNNDILRYTDETDKSLGIAGMAISLVAIDGEKMLASVSIEADEEPFDMAQEFFFTGNPRQSARIARNEFFKQFQVMATLALGNVLCRAYSAGHSPAREAMQSVRDFIGDCGRELCSLEDDEIGHAYEHTYDYSNRLFTHPQIVAIARDFATVLRMRRRMTAGEVLEQLSRLNTL